MVIDNACYVGKISVRGRLSVMYIIYFDESTIMGEWSHWEELNSVDEYADGTTGK